MKKIFNLFIVCFLLSFSLNVFSQTYSSIIKDSVIDDFIKAEFIKDSNYPKRFYHHSKRIYDKPVAWSEADWDNNDINWDSLNFENIFFSIRDSLKNHFTKNDIEYFKDQYNNQIIVNWNVRCKKIRFLKKPKSDYYQYTIPLFSKDLKTALFYEYYFCGPVCAYSAIWIYKKDGEKWIRQRYLIGWMS
jgi:hypothetical protein